MKESESLTTKYPVNWISGDSLHTLLSSVTPLEPFGCYHYSVKLLDSATFPLESSVESILRQYDTKKQFHLQKTETKPDLKLLEARKDLRQVREEIFQKHSSLRHYKATDLIIEFRKRHEIFYNISINGERKNSKNFFEK